jgi:hypothetical protein
MQLIRQVKGSVLGYITGNVTYFSSIVGVIQQEDYVNLQGYTALLQNLINTEYTHSLVMPIKYGLVNSNNIPMVTLEIDY